MFKSSEVFTYINDEAIHTSEENEMGRDTAFLQRCRRSKSTTEEEEENIIDEASSSCDNIFEEIEELPILCKCEQLEENSHIYDIAQSEPVPEKCTPDLNVQNDIYLSASDYCLENEHNNKRSENLTEQISNIQNQIQKLSNLPHIIQTAINDITKQVLELMPAIQERQIMPTENLEISSYENANFQDNFAHESHHQNLLTTNENGTQCEAEIFQTSNQEDPKRSHSSNDKNQNLEPKEQAK